METATAKEDCGFERSLDKVRKGKPSKPWKKRTVPPHSKVYKVAPVDFKKLVQKLTGASAESSHPQRLRTIAPSPLNVVPAKACPRRKGDIVSKERDGSMMTGTPMTPLSAFFGELPDVSGHGTGLGLGLSASPGRWFQFPLSSPVGCTETTTFL